MFSDGALAFREFVMHEPLPLAQIHDAVLRFLQGRDDVVLLGAQAVNAYVDEPRMTQDVDLISTRAKDLAQELRHALHEEFGIAVRVRELPEEKGFRVYQVRKPKNRHLVDIRPAVTLPPARRVSGVLVPVPEELIARKLIAYAHRLGTPKSGLDWRDAALLLLTFPLLKRHKGKVRERLLALGGDEAALREWDTLVDQAISADFDDLGDLDGF
jgi:hypothetical protein